MELYRQEASRLDLLYQQVRLEMEILRVIDKRANIGIEPHCKLSEALSPLLFARLVCMRYAEMCEHGTVKSKDASPR